MLDWLDLIKRRTRRPKDHRSTILMDEHWYLQTYPELRGSATGAAQHYFLYGVAERRSPSLYFDSPWYLDNNEDVAIAAVNPLIHYLDCGWREGRNPHPLFDINWYQEQVPFSQLGDVDPLTHYLMDGWRTGLSPHPIFDPEFYRELYPQTNGVNPLLCFLLSDFRDLQQTHPLFDPIFYLHKNEDVARTKLLPLLHYVRSGWKENRQPHPLFDAAWYLQNNLDVAKARVNPLSHFIRCGWADGRNPHPLFDVKWYSNSHHDVAKTRMNPLQHYCIAGWLEGRSPHPLFDGRHYLTNNPDVEAARMNPLVHYVQSGWQEMRSPHHLFDPRWYLSQYPDVAADGLDPLRHYLSSGWAENRNPGPFFDTLSYRSRYHDTEEPSRCPLLEYLSRPEYYDRVPHPLFDPIWYKTSYATAIGNENPLVDYVSRGIDLARLPSLEFERVVTSRRLESTTIRGLAQSAFEEVSTSRNSGDLLPKVETRRTALDVPYEIWRAPPSLEGKTVCLLAAYAEDGAIDQSTLHYMRALSKEGIAVILIAASRNAGTLRNWSHINQASVSCVARENVGYDFASWALGAQVFPELWNAHTIIFTNDSLFGPMSQASLSNLLNRIEACDADYIGLTQSWQVRHHYQSYFFALKPGAISHAGVKYSWTHLECPIDRTDAIVGYETTMLDTMQRLGLRTEVLFPLDNRDRDMDMNPTLDHWRDLLYANFPFIKIQTLRDEINGVNKSGWDVDIELDSDLKRIILEHLRRPDHVTRKTTIIRPAR
jgi:Rhamnan synthesis protein F